MGELTISHDSERHDRRDWLHGRVGVGHFVLARLGAERGRGVVEAFTMTGMPKTRLSEVAAHAGVSEATVSRVLNGKPGVKDSTAHAVLTALDVLGYERPPRLRTRSAGLVGLVVPELSNPIFPAFAEWIERGLTRQGYTSVMCAQTPGGMAEEVYVEMLLERAVSGIIFVSGQHGDAAADHAHYRALLDRHLPVVFIDGYCDELEAPFISDDAQAAARLAVMHLVSLGHRRIGLVSGPARFVSVQRKQAGFKTAVTSALNMSSPDQDVLITQGMFSVEGGHAGARKLLDAGATGIVCGSDMMALGAIRAVRDRGLSVPGDVSVIGYDDSMLMAFTDPPLTTIRQPVADMGMAAVRVLMDEISGHRLPKAEYMFRPELVVRGSTGPDPALAHDGRAAEQASRSGSVPRLSV